jgi:hypothetical protein
MRSQYYESRKQMGKKTPSQLGTNSATLKRARTNLAVDN